MIAEVGKKSLKVETTLAFSAVVVKKLNLNFMFLNRIDQEGLHDLPESDCEEPV